MSPCGCSQERVQNDLLPTLKKTERVGARECR